VSAVNLGTESGGRERLRERPPYSCRPILQVEPTLAVPMFHAGFFLRAGLRRRIRTDLLRSTRR